VVVDHDQKWAPIAGAYCVQDTFLTGKIK